MTGGLADCCSIKSASGAASCPAFPKAVCVEVLGSELDSSAPEGFPSASVLRDFFLNQLRKDINSRGTRLTRSQEVKKSRSQGVRSSGVQVALRKPRMRGRACKGKENKTPKHNTGT